MKYPIKFYLEYAGYLAVEKGINALPHWLLGAIAQGFAILGFSILRIRRKVILKNLAIAFPEKSPAERKAIALRTYKHFSWLILEFMRMHRLTPEELSKRIIFPQENDFINRFVRPEQGLILVSGHFGNWEWVIAYLAMLWKRKVAVIQKKQKNVLVNQRMASLRERWGMQIIYMRGAVRNSLRVLKENAMVGLLGDQDIGERGVFVPFFGKNASTPPGAAILHLKSGHPLVFLVGIRQPDNRVKIELQYISLKPPALPAEQAVQELTARYTAELERYIRQYPEQYFWMHKRWKSARPLESPSKMPAAVKQV